MTQLPSVHSHAKEIIFARLDVRPNVRVSACWLYIHEVAKAPDIAAAEYVLVSVLRWMDEQREKEARQRLEPTSLERHLLHMLINDGLTMKEIALRNHKSTTTTKQHFKRMRSRLGDVTLYQLVALSVERGWVKVQNRRSKL